MPYIPKEHEKYLSYNDAVKVSGGYGTQLTLEEGDVLNRRKTVYLFDYLDRLSQMTQGSEEEERIVNYEYDLSGNNTAVISPTGAVTKNEFDCFGNAVRTILPDGTENIFTYDFLGNVTSETNGAGETVFYTYDGLSRLTRTESSDGERVSTERAYYDFRGNTVKTLDANNNKTLYSYNERGFLDTVKQFENATDGQEISYAYDGEGNVTKMTIGAIGGKQKHTYKYELDAYGRMISETDPENNVATYEYDSEGNLISLRNKNGVTTSYTYDGLGRVLKQTNSKSGTISYSYNDFSEVVKITDGTLSVVNQYNSFGEVIETIRNSSSETYSYDSEGRIITHVAKDKDMGEVKTSYTYDVLGRTTSITTGGGTEYLTYDNAGRIAKKTIDSLGTEKLYSYYKNGLLKSVNTYRNEKLISTENSEYDLSGNKTLEETDGNVKRYAYDGLNRLKSVIEHNGDQTEYEFDSFGNISKEYTLTPGDIKTKYYHYDNANRLILMYDDKSSAEYTYDAEGNMLTKVSDAGGSSETSNFVYDGYNRLSEFYSQNTEAQYSYNPEGLRESKTVNGNTTRFLYYDGNIIGEFMGDDYYIYHRGTELIGYTSFSGKTANYQQNSHGNVTKLLDYDGTELKTYSYNAYGKEQAFTANPEGSQTILYQWKNETDNTYNPFRYCGEYVDAETGLIYLRNRYYDPSIGRFITEDPYWNIDNMIYGDNDTGMPDLSAIMQSVNMYIYCSNNPINRIDPSGEWYRESRDILNKYTVQILSQVYNSSNRARANALNKAKAAGVTQTWDNKYDAMRHFQWNAIMSREIGLDVAKFAANNHEIYSLVDAGFYRDEFGSIIRTRMNQATLMDLWNNSVGRTLGNKYNLKHMNYDQLYRYASDNNMLIQDASQVYEFLGITSYINEADWTIGVDWNLDTGNVTIMKEGLPNITLKVGK